MTIRITTLKLKSTKGTVEDIANYLKNSTEYYQSNDDKILPDGEWLGGLADKYQLNNEGRDYINDFSNLLAGYDPNTKEKLVQNAGCQKRRLGYDLTFSAFKDASIVLSVAEKEERDKIFEIHNKAVKTTIDYITEHLYTRAGKGGVDKAKVDKVAVWLATHIDSRDGDPQLHCHGVFSNIAECKDGKTRALDQDDFYQLKKSAQAIYNNTLAHGLEKEGYGIERERVLDADGRFQGKVKYSISGITDEMRVRFSKRRNAIEAKMKETNPKTGRKYTEDQASLLTRKNKGKDNEPSQIIKNAKQEMKTLNPDWKNIDELKQKNGRDFEDIPISNLIDQNHTLNSSFSKFDLVETFASQLPLDKDPLRSVDKYIKESVKSGEVLELQPEGKGRVFCSKKQWDLEQAVLTDALKRKDDTEIRLEPELIKEAIQEHEKIQTEKNGKPFKLTTEQQYAVSMACYQSGGLCLIRGEAGAGKTATAGAYIKAFQKAGFTCYGTTQSNKASEVLAQETGLETRNITKMLGELDKGKLKFDNKTMLVLDEAGMVGAEDFHRLQQYIDKAGGKLIAVGDEKQLQPISSGSPYRKLLENDQICFTELTEVRRQKQQADIYISNSFSQGKTGSEIIDQWDKAGHISKHNNEQDKIKALVADYMNDPKNQKDKFIMAQTHEDIRAINEPLREALKQKGTINASQSRTFTTTRTEKRQAVKRDLEICAGDRIMFEKNDHKMGVSNGTVATVKQVGTDKDGRDFIGYLEDGQKHGIRYFYPDKFDRFNYAYASTVHKAQGQGKDSVYFLARQSRTLNRPLAYVAFTRMKEHFKCYATQKDINSLRKGIDDEGYKKTAQEIGLKKSLVAKRNERTYKERSWASRWRTTINEAKKWVGKQTKEQQNLQSKIGGIDKTIEEGKKKLHQYNNEQDGLDNRKWSLEQEWSQKYTAKDRMETLLKNTGSLNIIKRKKYEKKLKELSKQSSQAFKEREEFGKKYDYRQEQIKKKEEEIAKLKEQKYQYQQQINDSKETIEKLADGIKYTPDKSPTQKIRDRLKQVRKKVNQNRLTRDDKMTFADELKWKREMWEKKVDNEMQQERQHRQQQTRTHKMRFEGPSRSM